MYRYYNPNKAYLRPGQHAWAIWHGRVIKVRVTEVEGLRKPGYYKYYWCLWINPPKHLTIPKLGKALWRGPSFYNQPWFPAECRIGHALDLGSEVFLTRREAQITILDDFRYFGYSNQRKHALKVRRKPAKA